MDADLADKLARIRTSLSARHIIASCEDSLRRLRTDWIDVFHMHNPDPDRHVGRDQAGDGTLPRHRRRNSDVDRKVIPATHRLMAWESSRGRR
ncbi:aldo/keto reductase [Amycolatopsis plumensis]|uniref:aldo/keto reductase n=1 Tax=Amycolatopsis plumensis TaxID=236508 RepID=UPI003613D2BC